MRCWHEPSGHLNSGCFCQKPVLSGLEFGTGCCSVTVFQGCLRLSPGHNLSPLETLLGTGPAEDESQQRRPGLSRKEEVAKIRTHSQSEGREIQSKCLPSTHLQGVHTEHLPPTSLSGCGAEAPCSKHQLPDLLFRKDKMDVFLWHFLFKADEAATTPV